jgi:hypothetical protein
MSKKQKTILVTFAGRRDRMELLTRYVAEAIRRGLIDEWHVWGFTRNLEDARWLRERFPIAQATPNNSFDYFRLRRPLSLRGAREKLSLRVRATNDVHIGLRRLSGSGPSHEIILGGWNNMASAIRTFDDPNALCDVRSRDQHELPVVVRSTPALLPEFGFSSVDVEIGDEGIKVFVAGDLVIRHQDPVTPGEFEVLYRTGFGSNGDWRFSEFDDHPERLFVVGPEPHFPGDAMFYTRAYQYYNRNYAEYSNDTILKCDDDIVYFDLEKLGALIAFRRKHDEYLLVSANVVNNGVCAHFQQAMGSISQADGNFELPPGGLCGSLWNEGAKAEALHKLFVKNPSRFIPEAPDIIVWNERVSINFVALLGKDLAFVPDIMHDDEHDLCYGVRKRAMKQNCIFTPFVASHLSFWRQDAAMGVEAILKDYDELANSALGAASASQTLVGASKTAGGSQRRRRTSRSSISVVGAHVGAKRA